MAIAALGDSSSGEGEYPGIERWNTSAFPEATGTALESKFVL
jgi:hypothetical protein